MNASEKSAKKQIKPDRHIRWREYMRRRDALPKTLSETQYKRAISALWLELEL